MCIALHRVISASTPITRSWHIVTCRDISWHIVTYRGISWGLGRVGCRRPRSRTVVCVVRDRGMSCISRCIVPSMHRLPSVQSYRIMVYHGVSWHIMVYRGVSRRAHSRARASARPLRPPKLQALVSESKPLAPQLICGCSFRAARHRAFAMCSYMCAG